MHEAQELEHATPEPHRVPRIEGELVRDGDALERVSETYGLTKHGRDVVSELPTSDPLREQRRKIARALLSAPSELAERELFIAKERFIAWVAQAFHYQSLAEARGALR
jgi:hypothetical protein